METPRSSHVYGIHPQERLNNQEQQPHHDNLTILETETSASEYTSQSERNSDGGASTAYLPVNIYGNSPTARTHDGHAHGDDDDQFYYDGDDQSPRSFTYDESHIPKEDPLGHRATATNTTTATRMTRRPSAIHGRTALYINYAAIGVTHGLLQTLVYPLLKSYLNMAEYRAYGGELLVALPWSFKLWIALLADCCLPMSAMANGQRRKPLLYGGWLVCAVFALVIACLPATTPYLKDRNVANGDAAQSGTTYMALLFFVSLGLVIADVASDAIVVELSHREQESRRGFILLTALMARYSGHAVMTFLTAMLCNSDAYGGTFGWSASPNAMLVFVVVAAVAALAATRMLMVEEAVQLPPQRHRFISTQYPLPASRASTVVGESELQPQQQPQQQEPQQQEPQPDQNQNQTRTHRTASTARWALARVQCQRMWKYMQRRVTLQTLAFVFLTRVCLSYYASTTKVVYETWLPSTSMTPLLSNLATVANSLVFVGVAFLLRQSHLLTSWKRMIQGAVVLSVVLTLIPMLFIVTNAIRSAVLTLLVEQLVAFVEIAASIVVLLVALEVTDTTHGLEASSFALFTSVANAALPFASSLSQSIGASFDAYDSTWANDTGAVRWKMVGALLVWAAFRLLTLVLLPLVPDQKREMAAFKATTAAGSGSGAHHRLLVLFVSVSVAFVLLWQIVMTLLAAMEATACLTVAGGEGC